MKPVRYDSDAEAEYLAAVEWYAARNTAVAERFIGAVVEAERSIRENPRQWPSFQGVRQELDVRRCLVEDFPFAVVYVEGEAEVLILAIAHSRRRPGYWKERVGRTTS